MVGVGLGEDWKGGLRKRSVRDVKVSSIENHVFCFLGNETHTIESSGHHSWQRSEQGNYNI